MTWKRIYWVFWAIYPAAILLWFPPWEIEWNKAWVPFGLALLVAVWGFGSEILGQRLRIGEARFDPETGQLLDEEAQQ